MAYQENHVGWTDRDRVWVAVKIKGTLNLKYFLHGEWWLASGLRGALRKPTQAHMFTDRIIDAGSRFWPIEDPQAQDLRLSIFQRNFTLENKQDKVN